MPILRLRADRSDPKIPEAVVLSAMDAPVARSTVTPGRVAVASGLFLVLGLGVYAYLEFGLSRTLTVGAERIMLSSVTYGTFREYIPVTGKIVPRTTVFLDAVDGGQVTAVHVEEGAFVTKGQPLVTFKNTDLQLQVIGAEAQLTEQLDRLSSTRQSFDQSHLRNQRELIEIDYQIDRIGRDLARKKQLAQVGGASIGELDDLQAQLMRYRALRGPAEQALQLDEEFRAHQIARMATALDAINKNLALARDNLTNLVVVAPITGRLTLLEANVGESKSSGQRVGRVDESGAFKVTAFVDEFYLARVAVGQTATVEISRETYDLEVTKLYPDVRDRLFEIDLEFLKPPRDVRRGQTVRMQLEIGEPAETLMLASGAFIEDTGGRWAFVVDSSGAFAERRDVRFGRRNPEGIEVLDGLRSGEQVITSSYLSLKNFDRIQIRGPSS